MENQKYDVIIFDCNNVFYRHYSLHKDDTTQIGKRSIVVGGVKGFLQTVNTVQREFLSDGGKVVFGFDNQASKTNLRKEIDPGYKANRLNEAPCYYRSLEFLQSILLSYQDNAQILYRHQSEFDDMALPLVHQQEEGKSILLITNDMDFFRLLDYNGRTVHVYDGKRIWDREYFEERYSFTPDSESIILYKSIRGDKSDNVPAGIPGFPKKLLLKAIALYPDVYEFIKDLELFDSGKWKENLNQIKGRLRLNAELVDFIQSEDEDISNYLSACKYDPRVLAVYYKSMKLPDNFDKRVESYLNGEKAKKQGLTDSFFTQPQIKRI